MVFGKKKGKNIDSYDLDCHSDQPHYRAEDEAQTASSGGISDLPDHLLIAELEFRGYTVAKKE